MNVQFVIAHSIELGCLTGAQDQARIKLGRGLGKSEFLVVYGSSTTWLTSGGCVEKNSIG